MNQVEEVMRRNVEFCVPETRTSDMLYIMKKYNYDDLLVVDNLKEKHLIGVVHKETISDEALKYAPRPFNLSAKNCMQKIPATVFKDSTIEECLNLMEKNHMGLLPVVDDWGLCVGVVVKQDILV